MGMIDQLIYFCYNTAMKNIFAKTQSVEFLSTHTELRNWRFLGQEMEGLGARLDAARETLARSKTNWSKNYWSQTIESLLFQWKQLPLLHDADAQMTLMPRWTVDYDVYELGVSNEGDGFTDRVYHKFFRESVDIEASWHNHRESRLARAQY
jgi:hypothetical protein